MPETVPSKITPVQIRRPNPRVGALLDAADFTIFGAGEALGRVVSVNDYNHEGVDVSTSIATGNNGYVRGTFVRLDGDKFHRQYTIHIE